MNWIGRLVGIAIAGCLVVAGAARAQGAGGSGSSSGNPVSNKQIEGRVQSIDATKHTLTIKGKDDQNREFTANESTQIIKNGQKNVSFSDIKQGDEVRASYLDADPSLALRIDVTTPGKKQKENLP